VANFLDILAWVFLFPCMLFAALEVGAQIRYILHPFAYQLDRVHGTVTVFYWRRWALASLVATVWLISRQV
jgi:hypothetical protein